MTVAKQLQHESLQFSKFITRLIEKDPNLTITFEEAFQQFCAYEARIDRLREELRPAYEASLRGESTPWNVEETWKEIEADLIRKGIPE